MKKVSLTFAALAIVVSAAYSQIKPLPNTAKIPEPKKEVKRVAPVDTSKKAPEPAKPATYTLSEEQIGGLYQTMSGAQKTIINGNPGDVNQAAQYFLTIKDLDKKQDFILQLINNAHPKKNQ